MNTSTKTVPVKDIPAVEQVLSIKQQIEDFKSKFPQVFERYFALVELYNTALEAADKEVRSRGVSCGPFENYQTSVSYDADKMFDELGEDAFLECGGSATPQVVYKVDSKKVAAAIASGKVPQECVPEFSKVVRKYRTPKPL